MQTRNISERSNTGLGPLINKAQTTFVGFLRIWSIPIVLMLSLASGFTTFYGMSHFILPWIALIITVAIQSIIVICSLEIAGIHWRANWFRYISIFISLVIAVVASVSFSYFKFYEISEQETIHINRMNNVRDSINNYLNEIVKAKGEILEKQRGLMDKASKEVSLAYFGTHPEIVPEYRNQVGEGPFWRRYNQLYQQKKNQFEKLEKEFILLDEDVRKLQTNLGQLDIVSSGIEDAYQEVQYSLQDVQIRFNQQANNFAYDAPVAPVLMSYIQFVQGVKPSFTMWSGFSLFAFACAAMVDFFTVLLSYRLEFTAPGPLTKQEEELVFECLRQFSEFSINENDELEMIIEKTELERARQYSDWSRMFVVGFLLSRGFLRKIDSRKVEFAPNLYPLIAQRMGDTLQLIREKSQTTSESFSNE